jgi:pyruvate formate lyase activating enzyme
MNRRVELSPWFHTLDDRRIQCDLCPRRCVLADMERGFCLVRQNQGGELISTTYGLSTGFCIDPVEKKPLNQFYPGSAVLSFGTAGCNLGCRFCQNYSMTKSVEAINYCQGATPESIAATAEKHRCRAVAYTYNDPTIWTEYARDTAAACRARGIKNIAVTAGYIKPEPAKSLFEFMDAANVDLKAIDDSFYRRLCDARVGPVLDLLRWLVHETDVWVEITNLIIPDENDSPDQIGRLVDWVIEELGPRVPVHFSAFSPCHLMSDRRPTPAKTLFDAYELAREKGVVYVYTGNINHPPSQTTYCPGCGAVLIERVGYQIDRYGMENSACASCGQTIDGHFDERAGDWGNRRQPVKVVDV